jgi:glyoxylate reductase
LAIYKRTKIEEIRMVWKVYVTREIPHQGIDLLKNSGLEVEVYDKNNAIPKDLLIRKVSESDACLSLLTDNMSKEVINAGSNLKIIANYAVGFNNIDLEAATNKKIVVTNTPGVLTQTTADLTWALLMATAKRLVEADQFLRQGKFTEWQPLLLLGEEIFNATLGIIGAGRIGTAVAKRASGFDMEILYSDTQTNTFIEIEYKAKKVDLETLFNASDYISLHVPLNKETFHLINQKRLKQMKPTAILINTSRGPVIDEKALKEALQNKWIGGAGLDVYEDEPKITPGLTNLPNAVLLPHIGSATNKTRTKMALMAAQNIVDLYKGKKPQNIVNPQIWKK